MPIIYVPAVADSFDSEKICLSIPADDCSIIAGAKFVVRVSREGIKAVFSSLSRLVNFVQYSIGNLRL